MIVLGISPLDKDATVSIVADGEVLFAAGEERYSRRKQHAGFPRRALEAALDYTGIDPSQIDTVAYPFLTASRELQCIEESLSQESQAPTRSASAGHELFKEALTRVPRREGRVHGLANANQRMDKSLPKQLAYRMLGGDTAMADATGNWLQRRWVRYSAINHREWQLALEKGLEDFGLGDRLKRFEHHLSHAANAYYASGMERALIITLDGFGSGLCGAVSLGEGGKLRRLRDFNFRDSLGHFYQHVTAGLGYKPDRHAGKIVGLAAYGDPEVLAPYLRSKFSMKNGEFHIDGNFNYFSTRYLAVDFPMIDVAAAYQLLLEEAAQYVTEYWVKETGCGSVVLSGGVTANVKMNQRIHEVEGVEELFVYPNMGDGGCGTGLGLFLTNREQAGTPYSNVYLGPDFSPTQVRAALEEAGLEYTEPANLAGEVAALIHGGKVVARFDGRMEYGPRALGNRSILYHAREPEVNQWLNKRLGRTEFMPFAPVTLYEERARAYHHLGGAEHAAEFMTVTFDCTPWMRESCPAAVHVDGTARPQLIRRVANPGYYDIVDEYGKLSGIPCLINTSFNMHEEPIVCTPRDAVRAFLDGRLDALAIGPYLTMQPGGAQ